MKGLWFAVLLATVVRCEAGEERPTGITVSEAFRMHQSDNAADHAMVDLPVIGMLSAFGWANAELKIARGQKPLFCQPERLSLTVDQVLSMLGDSVRRTPAIASEPLGFAILSELARTFPCAAAAP